MRAVCPNATASAPHLPPKLNKVRVRETSKARGGNCRVAAQYSIKRRRQTYGLPPTAPGGGAAAYAAQATLTANPTAQGGSRAHLISDTIAIKANLPNRKNRKSFRKKRKRFRKKGKGFFPLPSKKRDGFSTVPHINRPTHTIPCPVLDSSRRGIQRTQGRVALRPCNQQSVLFGDVSPHDSKGRG